MDKERFFTLMGKWPKIRFSDVCLIPSGNAGKPRPELYVRDSADPPCWLFIRAISTEESDSILALYSIWLAEFQRRSGLSPQDTPDAGDFSSEAWRNSLPIVTDVVN